MMMKDLIDYARAKLATKEVRQFERALTEPQTEFHDRVISPQFYRPDEGTYLGIAISENVSGRNHRLAENILDDQWSGVTYFTNPLMIAPPPTIVVVDGEPKEKWVSPMDRTAWGQYQVFTFEFDDKSLNFFQTQLGWFRSPSGKKINSPMGQLYRHCSQYVDFEGITVAWSGNKSFHIHIVFSTAHARAMGIKQHLRPGIMGAWRTLMPDVMNTLNVSCFPDTGMDQPEKFRRIPNGIRVLENENILGMPVGSAVPQLVFWEMYRDRSPKNAVLTIFDPTLFKETFSSSSYTSKKLDFVPSFDEMDFCRNKMRMIFNDASLPAFHDFAYHNGELRAHFANHMSDTHPASYMEEDYCTVNINGSNPHGLTPRTSPHLQKPLGEMIVQWSLEYQSINARKRTPEEQRFAMAVTDSNSARREICSLLLNTIRMEKLAFIVAPEGISKSTSLFDNHARIDLWINGENRAGIMYAFADYESAREKAADFNKRQTVNGYKGVVLESFERLYKSICAKFRIAPLDLATAHQSGFRNLWHAIEKLQPFILTEFEALHTELWQSIGDNRPVFFTVHAVAHNWCLSSPSRMMWAPSFWITQGDDDHGAICRQETALNLLIHDEVKVQSLIAAYPVEVIEWVDGMTKANTDVWGGTANATDRFADYLQYHAACPPPVAIDYATVQDVFSFHGHEWDFVETINSGEYGAITGKSPYKAAIGKRWGVMERRWPTETAKRTIVLTTESVPLAIAEKSTIDWKIFDLDTPLIKQDAVTVKADKGVSARKLATLCAGWQKADSSLFIVSNKVSHLPNTMTHARARGSNLLIGKNILQTMVFINPSEFEYLEALNAWSGRDDLIRHRHIDEYNQTAGRNLGFRKVGAPKHILLVNRTLFDLLVGEPKARARYDMKVMVNKYQKAKAGKVKAQKPVVTSGSETSKIKMATLRAKLTMETMQ